MHVGRILRRAAVAVTVLTAVIATGTPAHAWVTETGRAYPDPNNPTFCHYQIFAGTFYCNTNAEWNKPDYHTQVFVIGQDRSVYTKLRRDSGSSEWINMGGTCNPRQPILLDTRPANWSMVVFCTAEADGQQWYRKRFKDGSWSPRWVRGNAWPDSL